MLEGVVDSPSSSMETLKRKRLKFRRPKCGGELFHSRFKSTQVFYCSYLKFRKGEVMICHTKLLSFAIQIILLSPDVAVVVKKKEADKEGNYGNLKGRKYLKDRIIILYATTI